MPSSESPLVYLINRSISPEQIQQVVAALDATPVDVIIAAPADVEKARSITPQVTGLHRPIAIMADFEHPLQAVQRDGSVEVMNL